MHLRNQFLLASALLSIPVGAFGFAGQREPPRAHDQDALATGEPDRRPVDEQALFHLFSRMPGLRAEFTEEKHLSLLALPLKSRGVIYFLPPGHLTRIVEAPTSARLSITPDELRMIDADGEEVIDLHVHAPVRAFVTSLLGVFAGDRAGLARSFAIDYAPDAHDDVHWSLRLTPRAQPLSDWITSLVLSGTRTRVDRIELFEPNGDRTVTTIVVVDPRRTFTAREKWDLFGLQNATPAERAAPSPPPPSGG